MAAFAAVALSVVLLQRPAARTQSASGPNTREILQFALLFGVGDSEPSAWDGSIEATGARITGIEICRPAEADASEARSWKLSTRRVNLTRGAQRVEPPVLPNGVYVTAERLDPEARFRVATSQGKFEFTALQSEYGRSLSFLNGCARVERVPPAHQLGESIEEQDFPALAEKNDKIYLAYVEFRHGDRDAAMPWPLTVKPRSYEPLRRPVGGDQVLLREYTKSTRTWSDPIPVSPLKLDVYRVAVAVDGSGRVFVIWSAQAREGFDVFASSMKDGDWTEPIRLTKDPGPDLNPVAATDSSGAVWIAWQGARNGDFDVLVARQQGESFSQEIQVSTSDANDWAPQIATGPNGEVTVVWDTYDKGDYDVYARALRFDNGIGMEQPLVVAASRKFEARASAAYDGRGRLWIAYEESFPSWGKDFGAYETTGSGLFQGNTVRLKVFEGRRPFAAAASLDEALAKVPAVHPMNVRPNRPDRPAVPFTEQPNPALAENRPTGFDAYAWGYASKSYPRLAALSDGSMALAYRNAAGNVWGPLGSAWFENLVRYSGEAWDGPVFVPHSDGLLDQRPALAPIDGGSMMMVGTTDHRFSKSGLVEESPNESSFNNDLIAYRWDFPAVSSRTELTPIEPEQPEAPSAGVAEELRQVSMMRNYRVKLGEGNKSNEFRLLRGEFHRHTAVSHDGLNDGDLIDAFRYMLDAAYMDWTGCCDHDNGAGREYTWWLTQKMTDAFMLPGRFIPMFSHERSVSYPEGHRNLVFARRGIRPLPRLPKTANDSPSAPAPDTQMLYEYLRLFDGIAAVHTSGTNMGTDWRDNDPKVEPVVEIYQGDRQNYEIPGAPRANTADDSIGGWRPLGFVSLALAKGYRLGFQASSDHVSTHMSYCNLWVKEPTRQGIMEAFKSRRVYGATDNILADVRCAGHFMGEEFTLPEAPTIEVKLAGTADFAAVHIVKDGNYVYSTKPGRREVSFSWKDNQAVRGTTSYYYIRGEQVDGELVWVSPMWIRVE
ncbi:MAG: hypothetical protein WD733_24025 [Bryobacterales bacterium]